MAFANDGKVTISVDDWGPTGTAYAGCYAKATLTASASGDTVTYEIKMTTSVDGGNSEKPAVALYLEINSQVVLNKYWNYNTSSDGWNYFPTKNGSTYSGKLTTSTKNMTSIPITLKIATSQNAISNSSVWKVKTTSINRTWYTEVGTGKTTIKDNGNNTFTITAEPGTNGTNNPAYVAGTYWGYDTNYSNEYRGKVNLTISGTGNTRTVYAKSITEGDYGNSKTATTSLAVKQYFIPLAPGVPKLSYNKSRLTIKENWTFSWTASKTSNATTSPISGYKILLYKNSTALSGITINSSNKLTKGTGSDTYVEKNVTKVTVDPVSFGFKVKDKVKIGIVPYSIWGDGIKHYYSSTVFSAEETVQNAGIVYVRVSDSWKEGQVYVYENNKWNEAEVVQTRISDTWKESQ